MEGENEEVKYPYWEVNIVKQIYLFKSLVCELIIKSFELLRVETQICAKE